MDPSISLWKRILLNAYYHASIPYRNHAVHRLMEADRAPMMILFYHRVADTSLNEWTMPTRVFDAQIHWLRRHFDLISLDEVRRRMREDSNHRPAVSITFDDGYADNCDHALPMLIKYGIPCTYFVTSRFVLEGKPFPHDEKRGEPLVPNTVEQIRALNDAGIEIGSHSRTHADLGKIHNPKRLREELYEAREELADVINRPIRYFAFPFGLYANLNRQAFFMAGEVGYEAVCSAYGGYNFPGDDPFHLQRIHADTDFLRFRNWLTFDPRKEQVERFDYLDPAGRPPCENLAIH